MIKISIEVLRAWSEHVEEQFLAGSIDREAYDALMDHIAALATA